ncbi:uncharacterized protein [Palaemon carinicauda]|uniref:uncharacterized protein isoform X2 n=1 Tax=Palaemon carinicauda TaxID=392227 RepID=UPI0035B64B5B
MMNVFWWRSLLQMERLLIVMLVIPTISHSSFSDHASSKPPGSQSSSGDIHHGTEESSNFRREFRNRRSSIDKETLTNDGKVHGDLPSEDYFSTKYKDISQMESQLLLEASTQAAGRGILHKLHSRVLTSTVTTNTTITKFFTCTTAEPSTIPACTHKARSLRDPSITPQIVSSTLYNPDSYTDSYNSNPLETSFKGYDIQETQKTSPAGRFLITIHHSKIHTTTYVNTVTQIDYASTVSVIYRGCKPTDAVEAPVCGEPHFPPCYYGYHGHYHYYTYYCNPAVYLYQGPHGYYCANGDHCGEDPTDPAAQIGGDPALVEPPIFEPSPVIAARLDLQMKNKNSSENEQPEFRKGAGGNIIPHDTRIPGRINYSAKGNLRNSFEHVMRNPGSPFANQDNSSLLATSTGILSSATNPDTSRTSASFFP